jgi:ABC-type branched-subunit amino acid transport system substrate-binding protein
VTDPRIANAPATPSPQRREFLSTAIGGALAAGGLARSGPARAQKKYGPGVSDTEIRIGQTIPYSGGASFFGIAGRVQLAYVKRVNAAGGVNGRKINLISLDDGFSPPKTIEMTRKLVEQDEVLALMGSVGTPGNVAISKYVNGAKVPHVVVASGSTKLLDPAALPWTAPFYPSQGVEGRIYAKYLLQNFPNAKVGLLYQNDDYGKGVVEGFKKGLGNRGSMIVKDLTYELTDATVESQIIDLHSAGVDFFFQATTPKFAAQAIRKAYTLKWKPAHILISNASSVAGTLKVAGLEASTGLITSLTYKYPGDPIWNQDKGMLEYFAFMKQWMPGDDANDSVAGNGYTMIMMTVELLRRCGDDLTREDLLRQALNIREFELPLLMPGVRINTTPDDRTPFKQSWLGRFDGSNWVPFGDPIDVRQA